MTRVSSPRLTWWKARNNASKLSLDLHVLKTKNWCSFSMLWGNINSTEITCFIRFSWQYSRKLLWPHLLATYLAATVLVSSVKVGLLRLSVSYCIIFGCGWWIWPKYIVWDSQKWVEKGKKIGLEMHLVVEHMPSMHEASGLILGTVKRKKYYFILLRFLNV